MKIENIKFGKIAGSVALGLGVFLLALNSYTIVEDGEAKTAKLFGEIKPDVYRAGFYVVNPLAEFTTFDIKENMFKLDDVSIPSQDKFKSNADVTIQWSIDPNKLPTLQKTIGTQADIQEKILVQPLMSILREAGRGVVRAQDLFRADVQDRLQQEVLDGLREVAAMYGLTIHAVYIKDIALPSVIQESIITTKKLEEQESQEKARLEQQKLVYARSTAEAEAAAKSAEQNKIASQLKADAEAYRVEKEADANLYSKQKEAEGNKALANSVTENLLKLKSVEVQLKHAEKWQGGVPQTVLGESSQVLPLYNVNK